ncbi:MULTISPECIES: hypothetical protein [unclassified Pseudomonas]|uniref:hypothetical protein n=1 Tax=Pseudomonas sp. URMO17WK12:I2 TaxID=1261623 RepID=UPI000DAEFC25|nr:MULTISPECIES: hypothetical protein [unclassified Pseudomonas]
MSKFYCFFQGPVLVENPQLDSFAEYFLDYKPEKWMGGSGDGVFSFESDSGRSCDLSILESKEYGISVSYNIREPGERRGKEYYSVSNMEKINDIEDVGDDQFAPVGSFLPPQEAWLALEDFFNNPLCKSDRIKWINSDEIAWPD